MGHARAQIMVRIICDHCRNFDLSEAAAAKREPWEPEPCDQCPGTGAIYQWIDITALDALRAATVGGTE